MRKMRLFCLFSMLTLIITMLPVNIANAKEPDYEEVDMQVDNVGVSFEKPVELNPAVSTMGIAHPSKIWNISKKGKYNFSGKASDGSTLYTNYLFKGKNNYKIYVKNTGKTAITVTARRTLKKYATTKISKGKSAVIEFSNIKSDTKFYIVFEGGKGYAFEGNVK